MNYLPEPEPAESRPDLGTAAASSATDPYEALDDLMKVIEGLCPVWPDKELPRITVGFLL
jgi:hypothetical protein